MSSARLAKSIYALLQTGKAEQALKICEQALAQAPENADLLDARGMIHGSAEQLAEAETCFRAALSASPHHLNALNNLGNLLRQKSDFKAAADLYRILLKQAPALAAAHTNLGKALIGSGDLDEAEQALRRALSLDPTYTPGQISLAQYLQNKGDISAAIALMESGISDSPDNVELRKCCASMYGMLDENDKALAHLRHARDIAPEDFDSWLGIGNILSEKNKFPEAEAAFLEALRLAPDRSEIHNSLGILFKNREQTEKSLPYYRKALELDPDNAEAHNNLGNALAETGEQEQAQHHFSEALRLRPDFDEAHINRLQALDLQPGDPELERLKSFLKSDRLSAAVKTNLLFVLAQIHDEIGLYKQAFAFAEKGNSILAKQNKYERLRHRQVIDAVISVYSDKNIALAPLPAINADRDPIPVFIIGMSRSGKTLTESVLANHPDVYAGGERNILQGIVKSVRDEFDLKLPFPHFIPQATPDQLRLIGERYLDAIRNEASDARYFVDTMPSNFPYVGLIFQAFSDAKVITCQRHLLDNCLYAYFQRYKTANAYSYNLRDCAAFFADYHKMIGHWQQMFPGRILAQTYEDLVSNPEQAAKRLFEFCDLDLNPDWIPTDLNTEQVGRWHHYTNQLAPLVDWLEKEAATAPEAAS